MENMIAFPQPPELGWYPEDAQWCAERGIDLPGAKNSDKLPAFQNQAKEPTTSDVDDSTQLHLPQEEWDSTVLSTLSAASRTAHPTYVFRNSANGQEVRVRQNTVLGRKPTSSNDEVAQLMDSTRTVSRNHARIEFREDGTAWISDLDSLNGTFVIEGETETAVSDGDATQIVDGMTLRIGDEFYDVSEEAAQ
jgi:hypothetical protein